MQPVTGQLLQIHEDHKQVLTDIFNSFFFFFFFFIIHLFYIVWREGQGRYELLTMVGAGGTRTCVHPHVSRPLYHCATDSYSASHNNWCSATLWNRIMTAQCEGMGEVGSARYEPALLPPCPNIRVLGYSNCQEIHSRQQTGLAV